MSTLERAIVIAARAHAGAADKAGSPYILHPLRVMLAVSSSAARMAAALHDVVEDSDWTLEGLRAEGFSEDVLAAVDGVTRREGEDYLDFVRRSGRHPLAREVKIADLQDNMNLDRIAAPTERDFARREKHREALALLEGQNLDPNESGEQ